MQERAFIQHIVASMKEQHPGVIAGIGDDCAVFNGISADEECLVTTDMLLEGVHFDTSWHPPFLLGKKAAAVNLSDIAAMAGTPRYALLSLGVPDCYDQSWLTSFMDGLLSQLGAFSCVLVGGDTVSAKRLTINLTIIGSAEKGRALYRNGAGEGDGVFVTGPLGSAAAALHLFQSEKFYQLDQTQWPVLVASLLEPQPRITTARLLEEYGHVTAMQDISDGIATDLSHICAASGVGAILQETMLPAHDELRKMCRVTGCNLVDFQLRGGEDYELLFTVEAQHTPYIAEEFWKNHQIKLFQVGEIVAGEGVMVAEPHGRSRQITFQGYEHCSR